MQITPSYVSIAVLLGALLSTSARADQRPDKRVLVTQHAARSPTPSTLRDSQTISTFLSCDHCGRGDKLRVTFDASGDGGVVRSFDYDHNGRCVERTFDPAGDLAALPCPAAGIIRTAGAGFRIRPRWALNGVVAPWNHGALHWTPARVAGDRVEALTPSPKLMGSVESSLTSIDYHLEKARLVLRGDGGGFWQVLPIVSIRNLTTRALEMNAFAVVEGVSGPSTVIHVQASSTMEVELPAVRIHASPLAPRGTIRVTDTASRATRDVEVDMSAPAHLGISTRRPAYRGAVFPDEALNEVTCGLSSSAALNWLATTVAVNLEDAGHGVLATAEVALPSDAVRIGLPDIGHGDYWLHARALRADGRVLAEARTPLRRLRPTSGSAVRIDADGNIVIDGRPTFLLGWYGEPVASAGRGLLQLQNVRTPIVAPIADLPGIVGREHEKGLLTVVNVETGRLGAVFRLPPDRAQALRREPMNQAAPSTETRRLIAELVGAVKNEPGLLGYYLADEPEIWGARSDYLAELRALLAELDPYHPTIVTNMDPAGMQSHGIRSADILSPDPYFPDPSAVLETARSAAGLLQRGQGLMMTLWHAAGRGHFGRSDAGPYPYRTMRAEVLAGIIYGARGITGYSTDFFLAEPALRYGVPALWREASFLQQAVFAAPPPTPIAVDGAPGLVTWLRQVDGAATVIAANPTDSDVAAVLSHESLRGFNRMWSVPRGTWVDVSSGSVPVHIAPGDVEVLSSHSDAQTLDSVAKVEARIAVAMNAALDPANLLHASRGTRVVDSTATTRSYFANFSRYVTNGVRDDRAWQATLRHERPWVEVLLPHPEEVRKVVVDSNLGSFDLDLTLAEGSHRSYSSRGIENGQTTIELSPPARNVVRLRITALATRGAGETLAVIDEISAYGPSPGPARRDRQRTGTEVPGGTPITWAWNENTVVATRSGEDTVARGATPRTRAVLTGTGIAAPARRYLQLRTDMASPDPHTYYLTVARCRMTLSRPALLTIDLAGCASGATLPGARDVVLALPDLASSIERGPRPTVTVGPLRFSSDPANALLVTRADGTPASQGVHPRDELTLRMVSSAPVADVVVQVWAAPFNLPIRYLGDPYVALAPSRSGTEWTGTLRWPDVLAGEALICALVSGGAVRETCAFVSTSRD